MVAKLSVNLNAIAMIRNRRDLPWPSVTRLGAIALEAGAAGLTVHPRPDERHIRFSDVPAIRALIDDRFPDREFNIEGFPGESFLDLCIANQPEQVTLVPDHPDQATSDHGWDFLKETPRLQAASQRLRAEGIRVSMFCDPDATRKQVEAARSCGADRIELYTGPYGACHDDPQKANIEIGKLAETAGHARECGLGVNAGHDLTVANLSRLAQAIEFLDEVSIGHALTSDALEFGMAGTVRRFLDALGYEREPEASAGR